MTVSCPDCGKQFASTHISSLKQHLEAKHGWSSKRAAQHAKALRKAMKENQG